MANEKRSLLGRLFGKRNKSGDVGASAPAAAPPPAASAPAQPARPAPSTPQPAPAQPAPAPPPPGAERLSLGGNEIYRPYLLEAAQRTGIDPSALAALISAEAAVRSGVWDAMSRASSSSAAGLTQFLDASWIEQAEKAGTLLNEEARRRGLLDAAGKVAAATRQTLLDLRFDPRFSIVAAAEYGRQNLDFLASRGVAATGDDERAVLMYIAHHEGPGGARQLLDGTLDEARADRLLPVQVGQARAAQLKAEHGGSAKAAYIAWLKSYAASKIQPGRFRA